MLVHERIGEDELDIEVKITITRVKGDIKIESSFTRYCGQRITGLTNYSRS